MNAMAGAALAFDLGPRALIIALVRGMSVAAAFSLLGTLVFAIVLLPMIVPTAPAPIADLHHPVLRRLLWISISVSGSALLAWLVLEAADLAEAESIGQAFATVPKVLLVTVFGHVIALQLLMLAAATLILAGLRQRWGYILAAAFAAILVALEAGHTHALAMHFGPSFLLASQVVHLLAGAVWLGGLLPLLLFVHALPVYSGAKLAWRFSPIGAGCVLALATTASYQGWVLVGGLRGLSTTAYGLMALVKISLFFALLCFAAINRFYFTPALSGGRAEIAKSRIVFSIGVEAGLGLCIVLAAGVLSTLPPGMHMNMEMFRESVRYARLFP